MICALISAISRAAIKTAVAFPPFKLHDILKALYIRAIIQMPNTRFSSASSMNCGVMLFISAGKESVCGMVLPNAVQADSSIGQRASAIVPATSIKRIAECDNNSPPV